MRGIPSERAYAERERRLAEGIALERALRQDQRAFEQREHESKSCGAARKLDDSRTTALIGGQVSIHFSNPQTSGAFIKAGRLRGLAVTSATRLKAFPDIPTMAEAGVPGCEGGPFWGVAAPAKTPKTIILKLNGEFNRILGTAELRRHFANEDVQVAGGSPEEFAAFLRKEVTLWGKVVREAKIRAE